MPHVYHWTQANPGASVSEHSRKLILHLEANGDLRERLEVPDGPRHNQLRLVLATDEHEVLVGGFEDGPGTHSADHDQSRLRSDLVIKRLALP